MSLKHGNQGSQRVLSAEEKASRRRTKIINTAQQQAAEAVEENSRANVAENDRLPLLRGLLFKT